MDISESITQITVMFLQIAAIIFMVYIYDHVYEYIYEYISHHRCSCKPDIKKRRQIVPEELAKAVLNLTENNRICCICQASIVSRTDMTISPCLHLYHDSCLDMWRKQKSTCPTCNFAF